MERHRKRVRNAVGLVWLIGFVLICTYAEAETLSFTTTAVGASSSLQVLDTPTYGAHASFQHAVDFRISPLGTTSVSSARIMIQGSPDGLGANNQAITNPNLGVGSTAELWSNDLFYYRISSVNYSAIASAVGNSFVYSHEVGPSGFGAIAVYIDDTGAYSTKVYGTQTDTMTYTTALRAINSLASTSVSAPGAIRLGYVLIENDLTTWVAGVDDLTDGSDVAFSTFYNDTSSYIEVYEYTLTATDIALQKGRFYVADTLPTKHIRIFLSQIIGVGTFEITDRVIYKNGWR